MGPIERLRRDWRYFRGLLRTLTKVRLIKADSANLICDDLEAAVDRWRDRPAIEFHGAALTYGGMDAMANRYAAWAQAQGIGRGDVVALFLPNRLEYLSIWYGLAKRGVVTALINNQLTGEGLAHCLTISGARACIVDAATAAAFEGVRPRLSAPMEAWSLDKGFAAERDLTSAVAAMNDVRPDRAKRAGMTARDTALFIYTSGTTGLPKAARITHMRAQLFMCGFAGATGAVASDRVFQTLPLYHATGGMCAMGAALLNGGVVILREGFSASNFWRDVVDSQATLFVYVGELCRYLVAQPPVPLERSHRLRMAFGNGMARDVWTTVIDRFGIPQVLEFYGSTEGNVAMFNFDGGIGAIGRVPRLVERSFNAALVRFDVEAEAVVRGSDGLCVRASEGEVGECVGRIAGSVRESYSGYLDKSASESKVLHDVFQKGDAWFRTGDLMKRDADGYYYFIDRIGDTFRWKGENVSTTEVAGRLMSFPGVQEAIVYGVKVGASEGRAGMAALVVDADFDIAAFGRHVVESLAPFAQPLFVRIALHLEITGTFKPRKVDLMKEGFDPVSITTPLYVLDRDAGYIPLTAELHARIIAGAVRL